MEKNPHWLRSGITPWLKYYWLRTSSSIFSSSCVLVCSVNLYLNWSASVLAEVLWIHKLHGLHWLPLRQQQQSLSRPLLQHYKCFMLPTTSNGVGMWPRHLAVINIPHLHLLTFSDLLSPCSKSTAALQTLYSWLKTTRSSSPLLP